MAKGLTPEAYAKEGSEHAHQVALFMWVALIGVKKYKELSLLFAVPNGGQRNPAVARRLKAEGVKAGVSDIFLPVARGGWAGLFIELKKIGGKANDKQLEFGKAVCGQNYGFCVCEGWESARDVLLAYLDQPPTFNQK